MSAINDGGPDSLDIDSSIKHSQACQKFIYSTEVLPIFLIKIMNWFPDQSGALEQTVTFTARAEECAELHACFTESLPEHQMGRKYTIRMEISSITEESISKKRLHQITKNSITLGRLLKETGNPENTHKKRLAHIVGFCSIRIQITEEVRLAAQRFAPSKELLQPESQSEIKKTSLRDYFAGQALVACAAKLEHGVLYECNAAEQTYALADAMLAARERKEDHP